MSTHGYSLTLEPSPWAVLGVIKCALLEDEMSKIDDTFSPIPAQIFNDWGQDMFIFIFTERGLYSGGTRYALIKRLKMYEPIENTLRRRCS